MRIWMTFFVLAVLSREAFANDHLTILSPHRKSIQNEFIPVFRQHYKDTYKTDIVVDWIDQGGTSDDIRFLRAKFDKNPKSAGIDIFWGGGTTTFTELSRDQMLAPYQLPEALMKELPSSVSGMPLYDKTKTWYGSAMSTFGIFYNKKIIAMDKIPEPKNWEDLANPQYKGQLSIADARRSGSTGTMNHIILQSLGWDKGWSLLTKMAANNRNFTHSSSDPIKAVVSGDVATAMAIDFYALPKIDELGKNNLGFTVPAEQTIFDPDPVAIVKGAPNRQAAERFVNFVLSAPAQKLLILPKGAKDGPRGEALGRLSVNTAAYNQTDGKRTTDFNPFKQKSAFSLDLEKAAKLQRIMNDLIGAMHIDTHKQLREAWEAVIKRGLKPEDLATLGQPPMSEKQLLDLAAKWDNEVLRNKTINEWVELAKAKYAKLAKASS